MVNLLVAVLLVAVLLVAPAHAKKPKKPKKPAETPLIEAIEEPADVLEIGCPTAGEVVRYDVVSSRARPNVPESGYHSVVAFHVAVVDEAVTELRLDTESTEVTGELPPVMQTFLTRLFERSIDAPDPIVRVTYGALDNRMELANIEAQRAFLAPALDEMVNEMLGELDADQRTAMEPVLRPFIDQTLSDAGLSQSTMQLLGPVVPYHCGLYNVGTHTVRGAYPSPFGQGPELPSETTIAFAREGGGSLVTVTERIADIDMWALLGPVIDAMGIDRSTIPDDVPPFDLKAVTVVHMGADGWPTHWTFDKRITSMGQEATDTLEVKRLP